MKRVFLTLFLILSLQLSAENLRGFLRMPDQDQAWQRFHLEDLIAIPTAPQTSYQSGWEVEIVLPEKYLDFRNSFALYAYHSITPEVDIDLGAYSGERIFFQILPVTGRFYFHLPLEGSRGFQSSPNIFLGPEIEPGEQAHVIITILPVMKGLPDLVYNEDMSFSVRPLLADQGGLMLEFPQLESSFFPKIRVHIDDQYIDNWTGEIILNSGLHQINVHLDGYHSISRTISIEQGDVLELALELAPNPPLLAIEAPEGSNILLDGENLSGTGPWEVTKGQHLVELIWGEYTFREEITIDQGGIHTLEAKLELFFYKPE